MGLAPTQTRRPFFRRRKTCPFSGANAPKIDYKDVRGRTQQCEAGRQRGRRPMVGADADPSLTADEAGQLAMLQIVLVGLGAGAASALLFAVAAGTAFSLLLALLAPLPILIVALGWSSVAG